MRGCARETRLHVPMIKTAENDEICQKIQFHYITYRYWQNSIITVGLFFFCLFGVVRHTWEFFSHMKKSPIQVNDREQLHASFSCNYHFLWKSYKNHANKIRKGNIMQRKFTFFMRKSCYYHAIFYILFKTYYTCHTITMRL